MSHELSHFMVRFWMEKPNSNIWSRSRRTCGPHLASFQPDRDTFHSWKMQEGPKQDFHETPRSLHLHSWEVVELAATPLFSPGHRVGFCQWQEPTHRLISSAFLKLRAKGQSYFADSDCRGLQPMCIPMQKQDLHKMLRGILKSTQHWLQSSFSTVKGIWDVLFFAPTPLLIHKDTLTRRWHRDFCGYILKDRTILFLGWSPSPYPSSWHSGHFSRLQASLGAPISVRHYEPSAPGSSCSIAANVTG